METSATQAGHLIVWTDEGFLSLIDDAFADSARRSGPNLVCRPGCNQCCTGIFAISMLDAYRLRQGYAALQQHDPERAGRVHQRLSATRERLASGYPGDAVTGLLFEDEDSRDAFDDFANDEVCPILDPVTGTCDLYTARPLTCRIFGPPVRSDDGIGTCELCFQDATEDEIVAAEMFLPPLEIEQQLTETHGTATTTIAFAIL